MKTPREILFSSHRAAESKLDAIRRGVVNEMMASKDGTIPADSEGIDSQPNREPSVLVLMGAKLWRELIWPSRRAWASLAILWIGIAAWNMAESTSTPNPHASRRTTSIQATHQMREQRRLLAELLEPAARRPVEPVRVNPQPRSERKTWFETC